MNQEEEYDAIVVGTGISGGWAAKELCENGLKTLVLERGRMVKHVEDYPTMNDDPWDMPLNGELTKEEKKQYHIQKRLNWAPDQTNKHFFVEQRISQILTQIFKAVAVCQNRDRCWRGCPFGGYFSSNSSTLPAAERTGNMTLRPNSIVHEVIYDEKTKKATGVRVIDTETNEKLVFQSKGYFSMCIFNGIR
ncbi:hypothetical protein GQR58_026414 [Nymphon striatum]|nr:hypothetical protein GQR58_026414 [Nymphon striatum]